MGQRLKVEQMLSSAEIEELEKFAREKARTIDEIHQWLLERQFNCSREAAYNWKRKFDELRLADRIGRSGELAAAIKSAVQTNNFDDIAEGAVKQLVNVVFEQAANLQADGEVDPLDVMRMTRSLKNLVGAKRETDELKRLQKQAVKEADATAKAGASAGDVVAKVREILGIAT